LIASPAPRRRRNENVRSDDPTILPVDAGNVDVATSLLHRFFAEEGFAGDWPMIAANLDALWRAAHHWAAIAVEGAVAVCVVAVTTMLYAELGRPGQIGDLYVLRKARQRAVSRTLIQASLPGVGRRDVPPLRW